MKGFKAEKSVPEHVPERGAAASQSLRAGWQQCHCHTGVSDSRTRPLQSTGELMQEFMKNLT